MHLTWWHFIRLEGRQKEDKETTITTFFYTKYIEQINAKQSKQLSVLNTGCSLCGSTFTQFHSSLSAVWQVALNLAS